MTDIILDASVDFTKAKTDVNKFVQHARKKMSEIMAAANAPGGSRGGRRGQASDIFFGGKLDFNDAKRQFDKLNSLQKAFHEGNIKWREKMEKEYNKRMAALEKERERMRAEFAKANSERNKRATQEAREHFKNEQRQQKERDSAARKAHKEEEQFLAARERARQKFENAQRRAAAAAQREAEARAKGDLNRAKEYAAAQERLQRKADAARRASEAAERKADNDRLGLARKLTAEQNKASVNRLKASRNMMAGAAGNAQSGYYTPTGGVASVIQRNIDSSFTGQQQKAISHYKKMDDIAKAAEQREADRVRKQQDRIAAENARMIRNTENAQMTAEKKAEAIRKRLAEETAKEIADEKKRREQAAKTTEQAQTATLKAQSAAAKKYRSLMGDIYKGGMNSEIQSALSKRARSELNEYSAAVEKHGARSLQAARAQDAMVRSFDEIRANARKAREEINKNTDAQLANNKANVQAAALWQRASRNGTINSRSQIIAQGQLENTATATRNRISRQLANDPETQVKLTRQLNAAYREVSQTVSQYGARSVQAAAATQKWRGELESIRNTIITKNGLLKNLERNTNSIRGSIDGLGSSYGGLRRVLLNTQVALSALTAAFGMREILQTAQTLEQVRNTLLAVSPSAEDAASNFEFLRRAGDEVGFSYAEAGRGFAQFIAATTNAGATTEQSQQAFLRLTMAARNLGLSSADTDGVIRALTQSFSKGRFSAEEIRQQLGDRMPIAMAALERATGKTGQELDEMMRNGEISTARYASAFIQAMFDMSGGMTAAERAAMGIGASLGRLSNAWTNLIDKNPALTRGLQDVIEVLTELLKTESVARIFNAMGAVLSYIASAMRSVVSAADDYLIPAMDKLQSLSINSTFAYTALAGILGATLVTAFAAATRAVVLFNLQMVRNPLGLVAFTIGSLVATVYQFRDTMVQAGGESASVMDILSDQWEKMWEKTYRTTDWLRDNLGPVFEVMGEQAFAYFRRMAGRIDSFITMLVKMVRIGAEVANAFSAVFVVMAQNVATVFENILSIAQSFGSALANIGVAAGRLATGDVSGASDALGQAYEDFATRRGILDGFRGVETEVQGMVERIETILGESGITAAQDFLDNFSTRFSELGETVSGSLSGVLGQVVSSAARRAAIRAADEDFRYAMDAAGGNDRGSTPIPPQNPLLAGFGGNMGNYTPPRNRNGQGIGNSIRELMQDLERDAVRAGGDDGFASRLSQAFNRLADAAENGQGRISAVSEKLKVMTLLMQAADQEMAKFIREQQRTATGNQRIAEGFMQSDAAGRAAEIRTRAYREALQFAREELDAAGNATGRYEAVINKLIPVLEKAERAERNAAAAREIARGAQDIELLEAEQRLLTANVGLREEELAALRARQANAGAEESVIARAEDTARRVARTRSQTEQLRNSWDELAKIGEQAFERVGSAITEAFAQGKISAVSFGNIAKAIMSEVVQAAIRLAVINPMLNSMFGGTRATLGGVFEAASAGSGGGGIFGSLGSLFGLGNTAANALGTTGANSAGTAAGATTGGFGGILGGVGAGFTVGSLISRFTAGNSPARQTNGMLGAGAGALAGAALSMAVPVLGPLAMGILGGAIGGAGGGLIGPGAPNPAYHIAVGADNGQFNVMNYDAKHMDEQMQQALAAAREQIAVTNAIMAAAGVRAVGATNIGTDAADPNRPTDFNSAISKFAFAATETRMNSAIAGKTFGTADELTTTIQEVQSILAIIDGFDMKGNAPLDRAFKAVTQSFDEAIEKAKQYGQETINIEEARTKALDKFYAAQRTASAELDIRLNASRGGGADKALTNALLEFDTRAVNEIISVEESLYSLGFTSGNVAQEIAKLTQAQRNERDAIIKQTAEAKKAANDNLMDRMWAATLDPSSLSTVMAVFERDAMRERLEAQKEGLMDMALLEQVQAAERLKVLKDFNEQVKEQNLQLGGSIREFLDGLRAGANTTDSPRDRWGAARSVYMRDLALARGGNVEALGRITSSAGNFLDSSRDMFASSPRYQQILDGVEAALAALPAVKSYDQLILEELQKVTVNTSGTTSAVNTQIDNLNKSIQTLTLINKTGLTDLLNVTGNGNSATIGSAAAKAAMQSSYATFRDTLGSARSGAGSPIHHERLNDDAANYLSAAMSYYGPGASYNSAVGNVFADIKSVQDKFGAAPSSPFGTARTPEEFEQQKAWGRAGDWIGRTEAYIARYPDLAAAIAAGHWFGAQPGDRANAAYFHFMSATAKGEKRLFKSGGWIGNGVWNQDSVVARYEGGGMIGLAGGEHITNAVQAARYAPELNAINAGTYNPGGSYDAAILEEIRALRQQVVELTRNAKRSADANEDTADSTAEIATYTKTSRMAPVGKRAA